MWRRDSVGWRRIALVRAEFALALMLSGACFVTSAVPGRHGSPTAIAAELAAETTADFFVSPKGNDRWSGRLADPAGADGPFATAARARRAVRELLPTLNPRSTVRVVLRGGTYFLDETLTLGPEDSGARGAPVVYAAAAGEKVVLSGGRRIAGGRWGDANGRKAWIVDLPEVKEGKWSFRQLFVNGQRRPRTRLPEQGEYRIESLPGYRMEWFRPDTAKAEKTGEIRASGGVQSFKSPFVGPAVLYLAAILHRGGMVTNGAHGD